MVVPKFLFDKIGGFDSQVGRQGCKAALLDGACAGTHDGLRSCTCRAFWVFKWSLPAVRSEKRPLACVFTYVSQECGEGRRLCLGFFTIIYHSSCV